MLEVRGLTQRFASSLLFEDVNLKLNRHNRYGLIGANGAGARGHKRRYDHA